MVKVLSLMKRKEGEHPKLAQKIPGMRGYRANVPVTENADSRDDARSARCAGTPTRPG